MKLRGIERGKRERGMEMLREGGEKKMVKVKEKY